MVRMSFRVLFVIALLVGFGVASASAAEAEKPLGSVSQPLPFLTAQEPGCAVMTPATVPGVAGIAPRSTSATDVCTGCSGHNCFFLTVGSACFDTLTGRRGRCVDTSRNCPEIKEVSCTCES